MDSVSDGEWAGLPGPGGWVLHRTSFCGGFGKRKSGDLAAAAKGRGGRTRGPHGAASSLPGFCASSFSNELSIVCRRENLQPNYFKQRKQKREQRTTKLDVLAGMTGYLSEPMLLGDARLRATMVKQEQHVAHLCQLAESHSALERQVTSLTQRSAEEQARSPAAAQRTDELAAAQSELQTSVQQAELANARAAELAGRAKDRGEEAVSMVLAVQSATGDEIAKVRSRGGGRR